MLGFLAEFIMRGRMQAMMVASSLALLSLLLPPVSIVSSATVSLVTLRRGAREGLYVLLCSCLAAALLGTVLLSNYLFALAYGAVLWLPIWLISIVLREGRSLSLALEIAVLLGVITVVGFYLFGSEPYQVWTTTLDRMFAPMLDAPEESVEKLQQVKAVLAHYMTGIVAAGSVIGLLVGVFLARWWQALLYNPGGFKQEFLNLRVQPRFAIASVVIIAIALTTQGTFAEMAANVMIILSVLYTFIGTAILHNFAATQKLKRLLVPALYVLMFLVPHSLILVALVGLADTWLNLRKNLSN